MMPRKEKNNVWFKIGLVMRRLLEIITSHEARKAMRLSNRKMNLEFHYYFSGSDEVRIAVNSDNYYKGLFFGLELFQALIQKIPFPFEITSAPEFRLLGGSRRKGVMSIELVIRHSLPNDEVASQLDNLGFLNGMENCL